MLNEHILDSIFKNRQEKVEENIQKEYHKRIKEIIANNEEERNNKKMAIISELYYKQGFLDGINFILDYIEKNEK